jgi:phosphoglucosamine mutase
MVNFFGTDGMRGKAGITPITKEYFYEVGRALASILQNENHNLKAIIGRDTRISGEGLESAIRDGLVDGGVNCLMVGVLPTPAISHLTKKASASIGIVISASHNESSDNGIKIFSSNGVKIDSNFQNNITTTINSPPSTKILPSGTISKYDGLSNYKNKCLSSTSVRENNTLKVIVDCANGAASEVAKLVLSKVIKNIEFINASPSGININLNCGSTDTKMLSKRVVDSKADIGIAFDGDADRVIMIDHLGNELNGDDLAFILASHWNDTGRLINSVVVGTTMTNYGTRESLDNAGIKFIEAAVGDKHVLDKMLEHGCILGSEDSGHITCMDRIGCSDGIISSIQVIESMIDTNKPLEKLNSNNKKYNFLAKSVKISNKTNINTPKFKDFINNINHHFTGVGRVVIRKSGTEPVIRVLVEHKDLDICNSTMKSTLLAITNSQP